MDILYPDFLSCDPNVDAGGLSVITRNKQKHSSLHQAICKSDLSVIEEILKNGTNVNLYDNHGNTPLFYCIKYYKNLHVIKILLEYGADYRLRSSSLNRFKTPIDIAIGDSDKCYAQMFIKIILLKNFRDKKNVFDLESNFKSIPELYNYFLHCVSEIKDMEAIKFKNNYSLYDLVTKKDNAVVALHTGDIKNVNDNSIELKYKIYLDTIQQKIYRALQWAQLISKLSSSEYCFKYPNKKKVIVDRYCLCMIGEFLCNEDLSNFVEALDKSRN